MLPPRLEAVLRLVPVGDPVADIGSGHGALALALAARGQRVIATERTSATMAGLRADLGPHLGVTAGANTLVTRVGEGLAPIGAGEVETAVIAGMGARTIVRILESAAWLPRWLVLQPIQEPQLVAAWIARRGWPATGARVTQGRRTYRAWRVEVPRH